MTNSVIIYKINDKVKNKEKKIYNKVITIKRLLCQTI